MDGRFAYRASDAALDDLRRRLAAIRWPDAEPSADWSTGVPLTALQSLCTYWREEYDWRRCEALVNRYPAYRQSIDGLGIHYLHVRSPHAEATPIILTHGWPGSFLEFLGTIDALTDPIRHGGTEADAFHVVVPSLPGHGFSEIPRQSGWNVDRTARAWAALMTGLGYRRYLAQGGDWGAFVSTRMAQNQATGLAAVHLNMPQVIPDVLPAHLDAEQQRAVDAARRFGTEGYGYFAIHSTRPQTIGYGLADSPAGQAAWIYDKFHAWTDNDGTPEGALSRDQMLDTITLYWLTNTATASARYYQENAAFGTSSNAGVVPIPVGCSIFPHEIFPAPRSWAAAVYPQLLYWNEVERGGHFAAFEEPDLFVREMRAFAAVLRSQVII